MLNDVVIDTNVLVHANTPEDKRFAQSIEFVEKMLICCTLLWVDEGFSLDISLNKSLIGSEYIKYLIPGSLGFNMISNLASNQRVEETSRKVPNRERKIITQKVRKPFDKVFLKIAFKSKEKILVSHDYEDFQVSKRRFLKSRRGIGVSIIEAYECTPLL